VPVRYAKVLQNANLLKISADYDSSAFTGKPGIWAPKGHPSFTLWTVVHLLGEGSVKPTSWALVSVGQDGAARAGRTANLPGVKDSEPELPKASVAVRARACDTKAIAGEERPVCVPLSARLDCIVIQVVNGIVCPP
jgi:hypothetical protein